MPMSLLRAGFTNDAAQAAVTSSTGLQVGWPTTTQLMRL